MLIGCAPEPQPSQLDAIQERGVLRVGTLLGPTSYYLDAEAEAGFEYHLVRRFADRLGVELEIVPRYNINHLFDRSEEHTSELQSRPHLVCRLLLEKKKKTKHT